MDELKKKKLFFLDMDGTVYIENELIPGAKEFLDSLLRQNKRYVFLTNNSSKGTKEYLKKLNSLGITADESNIFTSGMATALYIIEKDLSKDIYVVGTRSFKEQLRKYDLNVVENIDCAKLVVVGFDTELNYEKITNACELISRETDFIATNPDLVCPVADGKFIPDCGAICNMIELATNKKPIYIGKPRKEMVDVIARKEGVDLSDVAIVGDRLYTDIACGINAGITSIAVLTGETTIEELKRTEFKPNFVLESIKELYDIINK